MCSNAIRLFYLISCLVSSAATQASYVYHYDGNPFQIFEDSPLIPGTYSELNKISGYVKLSERLPDSLEVTSVYSLVEDFSFTDGRITVSDSTPNLLRSFVFGTDNSGSITEWFIKLQQASPNPPLQEDSKLIATAWINSATSEEPANFAGGDGSIFYICAIPDVPCFETAVDSGENEGIGGSWVGPFTPVPLPPAFMLLAACSALIFRIRKSSN